VIRWRQYLLGQLTPVATGRPAQGTERKARATTPPSLSSHFVIWIALSSWRRNPCYDATHHELNGSTRHLALPLPASAGHGMRALNRLPT
jgi:hypothetical protein